VPVRDTIAEEWLACVLRSQPGEPARFLGEESDPFRNPMGHMLREAVEVLLRELFQCMDQSRIAPALDSIVKIRAVQDLTPSQAMEFLFQLKTLLRKHVPESSLEVLYPRIDTLALHAFDLYMKHREAIYALRADEARRQVYVLERTAGLRRQAADGRGET